MDAFVCVGPLIDEDQAARLRVAMLEVFSAIEPDADPDEVVSFARPNPTGYSDWLRDGLATTFLLFAVWGPTAKVNLGGHTGQAWANSLLRELPGLNSDPRVLTSLKDELSLLAEAAPDSLLAALEHMLEGNRDLIRAIFNEQEGLLFPVYKHTGVLWALETIAWDPEHFRRAVLLLAGLAEIAPEIHLLNTTANSLKEVFLLWSPNTNASSAARLAALKEICDRYPSVGWKLVKGLLPTVYGASAPTAKPRLRESGAADRAPITYRELRETETPVVSLAIALAADDVPRWLDVIPFLSRFAPAEREAALISLDHVMGRATSDGLKRLWTGLRDEVARHERFSNAQWTLKDEQLDSLRVLAHKYEPDDPIAVAAALFDSFALDETNDLTTANRRRAEAFRRLYDSHGGDAVIRLAAEARVPYLAVEAAAGADLNEGEIESLLRTSFQQDPTAPLTVGLSGLYRGLVGEQRAEVWVRLHAAVGPPDVVSDLLRAWPDGPSTWNVVRRLAVSSRTLMVHSYRGIRRMRYGPSFTREGHNDRGGPSSDTA